MRQTNNIDSNNMINDKNVANYKQEIEHLQKELKDSNKKLLDAESIKSMFLSNIRNEINNPLTSILGLSSMIYRSINAQSIKQNANLIHEEAFNLNCQLKNIFTAAELEAGILLPEITKVNIIDLLEEITTSFDRLMDKKQIKFNLNFLLSGQDIIVYTDASKVRLILSNLIRNAIEFSENFNVVNIVAQFESQRGLILSVEDHGEGFEPDAKKLIFDRFKQLDSGVTKSHSGHGLGLSVSTALAEIIGADLEVESEPKKGSIFTLVIPIIQIEEGVNEILEDSNEFLFGESDKF